MLPRLFWGAAINEKLWLGTRRKPQSSFHLEFLTDLGDTFHYQPLVVTRSYTSWSLASQSSSANVTNVGGFPLLNVVLNESSITIEFNQTIW